MKFLRRRSATTPDLLAALRAEAAPEHHALIDEWVREVSFLDLSVEAERADNVRELQVSPRP